MEKEQVRLTALLPLVTSYIFKQYHQLKMQIIRHGEETIVVSTPTRLHYSEAIKNVYLLRVGEKNSCG